MKFDLFIGKNNFNREYSKYDDFMVVGEFSKKSSIKSSFLFEKNVFGGKHPMYGLRSKNFSTELLENASK